MVKRWDFSLLDLAGVIGLALDRDGRIVEWNSSCERSAGYPAAEARGQVLFDLVSPPEDRAGDLTLFREILGGRTAATHEARWVTRGGELRWIQWSHRAVAGPDGQIDHVLGIGTDITERKEAEGERTRLIRETREARLRAEKEGEAARLADRLVASIVENLPDMVFVKDAASLRFILFNRAGEELLGWSRRDLVGKTDRDFFPASQASHFEENDRAVLAAGTVLDILEEAIDTRYGPRILHTKKVPILAEDGTPRYLLGISEDVTERNQAERERAGLVNRLQEAVRAHQDVLAIVSHDLRNPLSTILLGAGALITIASDTPVAAAARRIHRSAEYMNRLIGNLLQAAAIEAGQFPVTLRTQEVAGIIDEALELLRPVAHDRAITLERRLAPGLPAVRCDREGVLQVLSNLLGNAIRFSPAGESVIVSAEPRGPLVCFAVADRGPGVPADARPHVFERYWQAQRTSRESAGLGLFIVKGIVEAHGGTVWVEPREGGGSAFFFTLPAG